MSSSSPLSASFQLPPERPYRVAATAANGWSDQYGALHVAADYAGVTLAPGYGLRGIWAHGCVGPWLEFSADLLTNHTPRARELPNFVVRREHAALLAAAGHARVRAIGLPINYTRPSGLARQAGSLLVMPTHTLVGDRFSDRTPFQRYADEVAAVAGSFERVVVCVHPSCRQNGLWVDEFSRHGFEIVTGAYPADLNALRRMRALFEQAGTMTTNGWGSHVAYALAFGARVAIHGTKPQRSEADYLRDVTWAADPAALRRALSTDTAAKQRLFLEALHRLPAEAVSDVALGRWFTGADLRISPEQMRTVLEELLTPGSIDPTSVAIGPAREARAAARLQAREFVAAGRRADAIQVLIRAAKQDVATKNQLLIVESLVEIGDDLESLEPKQSAFLLTQAERIATANHFDLPAIRARLLPASPRAAVAAD